MYLWRLNRKTLRAFPLTPERDDVRHTAAICWARTRRLSRAVPSRAGSCQQGRLEKPRTYARPQEHISVESAHHPNRSRDALATLAIRAIRGETVHKFNPTANNRSHLHHLLRGASTCLILILALVCVACASTTMSGTGSHSTPTRAGTIAEFPADNPSDLTIGPDGNIWFTGHEPNYIGRITPTGETKLFPTPVTGDKRAGIAAGPDGALWFSEFAGNKIGRLTVSGAFTFYPLPHPSGVFNIVSRTRWQSLVRRIRE